MRVSFALNGLFAALSCAVLFGCASGGGHAPVSEHGVAEKKLPVPVVETVTTVKQVTKSIPVDKDSRPQTYVVQKGDTLFSIAFNNGLDYHDIADLNAIQNPYIIQIGQEIRLFPAGGGAVKPNAKVVESKPLEIPVKSQPLVAILPYSEQAVADVLKMQEVPHKSEPLAIVKTEHVPEAPPEIKPEVAAVSVVADDAIEWGMPATGKLIGEFSESANRKGVDIAGKLGQPIVASAAGKVVYSGSGLRGYGKLVIIKHNNTFLTAYAHNDQVLVKEGQVISKGQKIAEMGSSDADQVKLHFEIRKFGKPVDPSKYLSLPKS
jgi:lipoprotein NlpD